MWFFNSKDKQSGATNPRPVRHLKGEVSIAPTSNGTGAAVRPSPAAPLQTPAPAPVPAPPAPVSARPSGPRMIGPEELQALLTAVLATIENWAQANNAPPVPPGILLGQVNSILQARNLALHLDDNGRPR